MDAWPVVVLGTRLAATKNFWLRRKVSLQGPLVFPAPRANFGLVRLLHLLKPDAFEPLWRHTGGLGLRVQKVIGVRLVLLALVLKHKFVTLLVLGGRILVQLLPASSRASLGVDKGSLLLILGAFLNFVLWATVISSPRLLLDWLGSQSTIRRGEVPYALVGLLIRRWNWLIVIG